MSADRAPAAGPAARGLRPHTPLRTQLVLWVVVLAAVAVGVVAAASALVLRSYLFGRIDNQLWESLRPLSSTGSVGPQGSDHDSDGDSFRPPTLYYSQVYDANGDALGGLGNPLPSDVAEPAMPRLDASTLDDVAGRPFTVNAADGTEWRVLVVRVQSTTSPTAASVAVAVPLNDVKGTVLQLVLIDVVVGLVALLLLAAVAYAVVRSNLRPLVVVEETAEAIAGGDLTRRVPPYDAHTEVGRLAAAINVMLGRIEQAFRAQERSEAQARASEDRMRRFVADASHELRTPLTTIRGFAELYRQGAVRDPAEAQRAMRRIEDAAARMGLLVDDLLLLARLDQQRPLAHEPVDLLTLATDAVHDAAMLGPDHAIRLAVLPGEVAPVVDGDPQRLRQVVSNLLGNAVHHTPPGTQVIVTVGVPADGWALLEVRDDGPGLAPADAERVFERFYRADASRTRAGNGTGSDSGSGSGSDNGGGGSDAPGTGLGLAIVAALVAAHGGTVDVESKPGHGTAFRVRLPLRAGQLR